MKKNSGIFITLLTILISGFFIFKPAIAANDAALLPNAVQQFFDNSGKPLSSGKIYFYEVGTNTLKNTYTSSEATITNPNPITLNAGGKAPTGGIYGIGLYRQLVKDRNDNTIWDAVTVPGGGAGSTPTNIGDGNAVGTVIPWSGLNIPDQYLFAYGQEISREDYPEFFTAITLQTSVICSASSNILTGISDTSQISIGSDIELALCVDAGTTVTAKTSSTVTLSNPSNVSINAVAVFFPFGNGNGTSTFNVPDYRDVVLAGRPNMGGSDRGLLTSTYFGSNPSGLNALGGTQSKSVSIDQVNLPNITLNTTIAAGQGSHTHSYSYSQTVQQGSAGGENWLTQAGTNSTAASTLPQMSGTTPLGGSGTALTFSAIQPTSTINYIIKVTPDNPISINTAVTSFGGMTGIISCGVGLTCSNQTVSVNPSSDITTAIKIPVKAATTTSTVLIGPQTIDGVSVVAGERVLVKNQTSAVNNGIYIVDDLNWTRALDFDELNEVTQGTQACVTNGTVNNHTCWYVTTSGTITPGTDAIDFNVLVPQLAQSSTDNAIVRFNGTIGGTQNSGITIDDSDNVSGVNALNSSSIVTSSISASNITATNILLNDSLQFGGITSSFPSIKRSSTELQARLADDSAFATYGANFYNLYGSSSGTVSIKPQSSFTSYNFNLPTSAGTSGQPLLSGGGGTSPITYGNRSGNTTTFATASGSLSSGNCIQADASGNLVSTAAPCGTGSGSDGPFKFNVLDYGADNTGGSDSTTAINNAIAAAYTFVNNVPSYGLPNSGTCVFFPPGIYLVSSINLTEQTNACLYANPSTVILYGNQQTVSSKPILDMTACSACTVYGINLFGMNTDGSQPTIKPSTGILLADDNIGGHSNKNQISFSGVQGFFTNPAIYIFGSTDNLFQFSTSQNSNCGSGALFITSVNDYAITSPYATISSGTNSGENTFLQHEVHDCGVSETAASVRIHSAYAIRFYGGNNDSSSVSGDAAHFNFLGTNQAITIDGVQIYSEHGQAATNVIKNQSTLNGLVIKGTEASGNGYSGSFFNNSGSIINFDIAGNSPTITTLQPSVSSCGTSPSVFVSNSWHKFGTIREGSSATGCTITFNSGLNWEAAPSCVLSSSNPLGSLTQSTSTGSITVTHTSNTNVLIYYRCD